MSFTPPSADEQIKHRREIFDQMLAILRASSFEADDTFRADMEPLLTGQMTPEEHRAHLMHKYKSE